MNEFSALLERAKRGERDALTELHLRYGPLVLARIRDGFRTDLRRRYDPEDLSQSVAVEVLRDLADFEDRGEAAFRHWLYIKAESKIVARLRSEFGRDGSRRTARLSTEDGLRAVSAGDGPETGAERADAESRLHALIAALDDADREILLLRGDDGLSFADIADRLSLPSAEAARKRYARTILRVRELWMTP